MRRFSTCVDYGVRHFGEFVLMASFMAMVGAILFYPIKWVVFGSPETWNIVRIALTVFAILAVWRIIVVMMRLLAEYNDYLDNLGRYDEKQSRVQRGRRGGASGTAVSVDAQKVESI